MATYELLRENSWYVLWAITGQRADQWRASNAQVRLTGPPAGRGSVSDTDRRNVSAGIEIASRAAEIGEIYDTFRSHLI